MKNKLLANNYTRYYVFLLLPFTLIAQYKKNVVTDFDFGKYECTETVYRNGSYEFISKGTFDLTKDGKYAYYGSESPVSGNYTVDKKGNLVFVDGFFAGGKAERIDRLYKFLLVFPSNPDQRWTCGLVLPNKFLRHP